MGKNNENNYLSPFYKGNKELVTIHNMIKSLKTENYYVLNSVMTVVLTERVH